MGSSFLVLLFQPVNHSKFIRCLLVSYDQLKRHCVGGCLFYFLSLQGSQSPLNSNRKVILGTRKKGSSILKSCRKRVWLLESGDLEHCSLVGFCVCKMGQDTFWLNIQGCCGGSKEVIQVKFTDCRENWCTFEDQWWFKGKGERQRGLEPLYVVQVVDSCVLRIYSLRETKKGKENQPSLFSSPDFRELRML